MSAASPNTQAAIASRLRCGHVATYGPTAMLVARLLFAALAQGGLAAFFASRGRPHALRAAARWWMPSGTLVDLASLATVTSLTHHEGIRLPDLLGVRGRIHSWALARELGWLMLVFEPPAIAASALATGRVYGRAVPPQVALARDLPGWAAAYSVLVWPVIWAFTEELVYLGYAFPRLEVQLRRTWLASAIVSIAWAVQHVALPFVPDRRYLVSRVVSALAITSGMTAFYALRDRCLLASIMAHWLSDAASAFLATVAPRLPPDPPPERPA